ncbi:MAG: hypothetical protein SOY43_07415 [Parabacteroides sp.]|nr:hypothetical protein [Parabacteroides sp.]
MAELDTLHARVALRGPCREGLAGIAAHQAWLAQQLGQGKGFYFFPINSEHQFKIIPIFAA